MDFHPSHFRTLFFFLLFFSFRVSDSPASLPPKITFTPRQFQVQNFALTLGRSYHQSFPRPDGETLYSQNYDLRFISPFTPTGFLLQCRVEGKYPKKSQIKATLSGHGTFFSRFAPNLPHQSETISVYIPSFPAQDLYHLTLEFLSPETEIPFRSCHFLAANDNRFSYSHPLFYENILMKKGQRTRAIVIGASTVVDDGGQFPFPYILQLLLEGRHPGKFEIINGGTSGSTLLDHLHNWEKIQIPVKNRPLFESYEYGPSNLPAATASLPLGLKDLDPDILIICPMWNDNFTYYLRSVYENHLTLFAHRGIPLLTHLWLSTLDFVLHPQNPGLKKQMETFNHLLINPQAPLQKNVPIHPMNLREGMRTHFSTLVQELIHRARKNHPRMKIILLSLPYALGMETAQKEWGHHLLPLIPAFFYFGKKTSLEDLEYFKMMDGVQVEAMKKMVEKNRTLSFIDLSTPYHQEMQGQSYSEFVRLDYFKRDLYHFTPKGNEYLADKLADRLEALLKPYL